MSHYLLLTYLEYYNSVEMTRSKEKTKYSVQHLNATLRDALQRASSLYSSSQVLFLSSVLFLSHCYFSYSKCLKQECNVPNC